MSETDDDDEFQKEIDAANNYVVCEDDEWLIHLLSRVAQLSGHHVGSVKLSALDAYLKGYFMARIDAGLPYASDLLLNFSRWLLQSSGNPSLVDAMQKLAPNDEVAPFFIAFDEYLRGHGRPAGLRAREDARPS